MEDLARVAYAMMFGAMLLTGSLGALVGARWGGRRKKHGALLGGLAGVLLGGLGFFAYARI